MMLEQDQEKLLDEATAVVKEQAFYMKRAIDNENLRDSLKHGSNIICELRTSLLSPKNYYELYMQVFHELQHLASFFSDKGRHHRKMSELYESVQHAGNILPRLYLLITVGASYIRSKEAPAKDILRDMTELCKGVQHPMRGLFLRYYLTQMCKDKLPDAGSDFESEGGGSMSDAFEFLLTNFTESTRLWVRLQHQGPVREKQRRERERHDLRVLVGANLVRMSQLEGMVTTFYAEEALPKLIEQIVGCKDTMAQQYLLDCIIQVFSDECHLRTLDQLLSACMKVTTTVDLKPILVNLMNRLAIFVQDDPEAVPEGVNIFELFRRHLDDLLERPLPGEKVPSNGHTQPTGGTMELSSLLELQVAFLSFTLTLYPNRVDYVDVVLGATVNLLSRVCSHRGEKLGGVGTDSVVELLSTPLRTLSLSVLEMDHIPNLMKFLDFPTRKQVAISMVDTVLDAHTPLDDEDSVQRFFTFISPLVQDEEDTPVEEGHDNEEFVFEQQQVAKLVHAIKNDDTDKMFRMYVLARASFGRGGHRRMLHTLPPLVIGALKLVPLISQREQLAANEVEGVTLPETPIKKVFQFVHKTCTELVSCSPEVALRLFLIAAVSANAEDKSAPGTFEPICYEFLTQALVCYEEELSDSRSQFQGMTMLVGTLVGCITCLEAENYENLTTKITQHGAKLLKKPDQCRAVLLCSHLFWNDHRPSDGRRVLECLQKCLKIADVAVQSSTSHVALFAEILDKYVYYFERGNQEITSEFIQNLISLCAEHLTYADSEICEFARQNFRRTVEYLKYRSSSGGDRRYDDLSLNDIEVINL